MSNDQSKPGASQNANPFAQWMQPETWAGISPEAWAKMTPEAWSKMLPDAWKQANPENWMKTMMQSFPGAGTTPPGFGAMGNFGNFSAFGMPEQPPESLPYRIDQNQMTELQQVYSNELSALWKDMMAGKHHAPLSDRRFGSAEWQGSPAYLAQLYMINARFLTGMAESVDADAKIQAKIRFAVQQWIDALAPSNFLATNPEAQRKLIDTQGESLATGLQNMLADISRGRISQTDESVFEVGVNVGVSEGSVIFQNELFQLIQYKPLTDEVRERPLLLVPPCINKFYILDLQPQNSVVRYAVEQGHTVFLVSWRNPGQEQAHLTWDNYVEDGVIKAIRVVRDISKFEKINILGFCVGGTLLTTALSVLAARGEQPAESMTLLTTLLDFDDTGILDVFVDEAQVRLREATLGGMHGGPVGLMPARDLASSFSFLRPNDLVWNYVVSNYLKGEAPPPFDLLYWNADGTNLPGPFFAWYLRNTYLENNLKVPDRLKVCGAPVNFSAIDAPVYIYGSREDHIVPWPAAYASTQLLSGPKRFVLGASGHIAGVVNPPAKKKRSYWTYEPARGRFSPDASDWFDAAQEHVGSWWPDWSEWLASHAGKMVKSSAKQGNTKYKPIEDAPGSYVKVRAM